jgi:hypothetical protein
MKDRWRLLLHPHLLSESLFASRLLAHMLLIFPGIYSHFHQRPALFISKACFLSAGIPVLISFLKPCKGSAGGKLGVSIYGALFAALKAGDS